LRDLSLQNRYRSGAIATSNQWVKRVNINAGVVAEASAVETARLPGTNDWADVKQSYLVLRQGGGSVKWFVSGFRQARTIGDPRDGPGRRDYLPIGAARSKAAII
jgi:hypothetical protein